MFGRVLVANRGEIAQRIIRACRELGVETVAVYSEADADALYLRQADETVCIGPGPSALSYLNIPAIISAAEIADVDAIVPGYGFLAENAHFAEVCRSCNITFVGPDPETIASLGDKSRAREMAMRAKIPVVPGSEGVLADEDAALRVARQLGYPVMIKAAAGGGGRGMRIARNDPSLLSGFHQARAEAENAFKDGTLYLEKFIENPRHVEIQILGDKHGNLLHLFERDCSVQRRHQKMIEESPSPSIDARTRERMGKAALAIAREANYHNAGTVEFLLDRDGRFYFIEVNARIQVEHTVTELVTGIDLIQMQLKIASGDPLGFKQGDVRPRGHAIECRINAEDPARNFQPSPGRIENFSAPGGPGVRWDSHVYAGYKIPPYYDSMIGKLLAHREDRPSAIRTMLRALDEFWIEGPATTIPIQRRILEHPDFVGAHHDTGFVERHFAGPPPAPRGRD
ncbi:MAG TPA: acetyl-CoA carboxylase biotin carboxylase subunit [Planctomycetota bacterium]|nr:acetyl-CoA carboxylase biotin carboxylase subunit [Planctomycetota bacterium]